MKSLVESLKINSKSKISKNKQHKRFWDDKYCAQYEICELAKKAFDDLAFKPEDVQDEISQYKDYDDLVNAYDNNALDYYSEFENALYNLLKNDKRFKGYCDSTMDQVWIKILDLMEEIKD